MKTGRKMVAFSSVALMFLLLLPAAPAGASRGQDIHIETVLTFDISTETLIGTGLWSSEGLIESSGPATMVEAQSGWPPGYVFKTSHSTDVLEDEYGTITIQTQVRMTDWEVSDFPCDVHFGGEGQWVILSGSGAYDGLHGQGSLTVVGDVSPESCPLLTYEETYDGVAHSDP